MASSVTRRLHGSAHRGDRCDKILAGLLAAATDFGADAAVFVVGGMSLALITGGLAGGGASFDHCAEDVEIRGSLTRHDTSGSVAGVGAVEAKADAAHHLAHVALGEIGVGATRAAGGTVEAVLDTTQERVAIDVCRLWMCLDYVWKCHVLSFLVLGHQDNLDYARSYDIS